ncbi:hypothetical protein E3P99_03264 [Wallemia hederae]|uniref:Uncharacterized protein n=1 Tax=Wallemia hederae TaxID=1540922 RepID=A0A4V6TMB4_9BASI|nr:hypothetical protein E3P99_03264 [Wallemia hederae]
MFVVVPLQLLNDDFETCLRTISVHHESDELLQYITAVCLRRMLEIDACASLRIFKELLANKNLLLNEIYLPPLTYKKFLDRLIELEISDNLIIRQQLEAIQFTELKTLYEHAITI